MKKERVWVLSCYEATNPVPQQMKLKCLYADLTLCAKFVINM